MKKKLKILKNKINKYIKKHHNKLSQKHLKIIKILQLLRYIINSHILSKKLKHILKDVLIIKRINI